MAVRHAIASGFGVLLALIVATSAEAASPPFELAVKRDRALGSSRGTLVFAEHGAEYRSDNKDDARHWTYEDIKQVQVLSPTRVAILTYEDRGRLRLGADRTFEFEITQGRVDPALVAFLLERISRSVVTSVFPPTVANETPVFRVPVKHQRGRRGTNGALLLYDDRLVYVTETESDARFWRLDDIASVLRVDRSRLEVVVYEGGSNNTRQFMFELKADLSEGAYDALWVRVNPPAYRLRQQQAARLAEPPKAR